ncbi:MAG TPA: thiamine pyrophosphate-requiring protein [Chloroflexota bacterium]|nr:thiamine pyrophosphate-requiring protein [Chloroflexota bacterium]
MAQVIEPAQQQEQPKSGSRNVEVPADQASEALMAAMKLGGIDRLWFVSGSEIGVLQEAAVKNEELGRPTPKIMTMVHEQAALAAAGGDTVATGKPSSVALHVEVGLMNAGAAIHQTDRGSLPVLIISGYPPSAAPEVHGGRASFINWYQQVPDQGQIVRQYMRWDHKLAPYDNPGLVASRAIQVMMSEPKGPAYLALPRESSVTPTPQGARFPELTPARPPAADPADIRQAARWLLEAERPLISTYEAGANEANVAVLTELAELLGARVMADAARVNIAGRHPLNAGSPSIAPVPATDCILAVDAVVPWMPTMFNPDRGTKIIRIGVDPIIRMTTIYEYPADLNITAWSGQALPALLEEVKSQMTPEQKRRCEDRFAALHAEGEQKLQAYLDGAEADRAKGVITSRWLSHQLGETLPADATITHELCDSSGFNRSKPGTLAGGIGSGLGWAAPAAVGIKAADPSRTVVCALGDGSWMFSNPQACVWASQFHKAPVMFVIFNNRGYRTGTHEVLRMFPEGYAAKNTNLTGGWFDPPPNYSGEAAASGAYGEKVTDPNDLANAIKRGLDAIQKQGVPAVLDVWLPKHVTNEV